MVDTKSSLKEAKEAIKNKDFEKSLKLCKTILKEDKENYLALVFLGLSLQEVGLGEKAPNAFKKAIECNPTNVLAYNGLINYYEKIDTPQSRTDLVKKYIILLKLETLEKKLLEIIQKLSILYEFGDITEIVKAINTVKENENFSPDFQLEVTKIFVNLLSKQDKLTDEIITIYEKSLKTLLGNPKTNCAEYFLYNLTLYRKTDRIKELVEAIENRQASLEVDLVSFRLICEIFNEYNLENNPRIDIIKPNIHIYLENLLKLETKSRIGLVTKAILLLDNGKIIEAKDNLEKAINLHPNSLFVAFLLSKCYLNLYFISKAIVMAKKSKDLINEAPKLYNQLELVLIEALSRSNVENDLNEVLIICENCKDKTEYLPHLIRGKIALNQLNEAKILVKDLEENSSYTNFFNSQIYSEMKQFDKALTQLEKSEKSLETAEWYIALGKIYWNMQEIDKSLVPFLKAAKLEPYNYLCFLQLGRYYKEKNNLDKTRRCYEKSYQINPDDSDVIIELSQIYRKLKLWDCNTTLLKNLTSGVIRKDNSWAWLQLGLNYLEQEEFDKAIHCLRYVIRIDDKNVHCWESLADAYLARGAYTSALKCYEKTSELFNEQSLYPLLKIASIKQILGDYKESQEDFEMLLRKNGTYIPALKGLAETAFLEAKQCLKEQRFGSARDHAQYAFDKLIFALKQHNELSCLWKLIADNLIFVSKLPEKYCCLLVPTAFVDNQNVEGNKTLEKEDMFNLAAKCYCKCLGLSDDNILIWHDLASCYLNHSLYVEDTSLITSLQDKAFNIAQYCVTNNPLHWPHWNLLGNVALNSNPPNYALAQHSFIKSVSVEMNSPISWCNLGALYLILGEAKLANRAFSQAQRCDPNYVNSWVGQALAAELIGHEDTMDLFRHTTQLYAHKQGALGYGYWVCRTLLDNKPDAIIYSIHNMHAIPVACDALSFYVEKNPMDGCAWNMLGILKERMGLNLGAREAFKKAIIYSDADQRDNAKINYGRLLYKSGLYEDSIKVFGGVKEANFSSGCGLALSLFKDKQYEESYSTYQSTLHWLTSDDLQSDVLCALASIAYMFQGSDAAKNLLFQSIRLDKVSPSCYYAILSLGLLHNDQKLATLVLEEIQKIKTKNECLEDIAKLISYFYLLKNENSNAINSVSGLLHLFPDRAPLWSVLSALLIRSNDKKLMKVVDRCANSAMILKRSNVDVEDMLCLISLAFFCVGNKKECLINAQKAIFCYPNSVKSWTMLISSLAISEKTSNYAKHYLKCIDLNVGVNGEINKWVGKVKAIYSSLFI